ncbi:alanine--tRNA ligase [Candidatus Berkelbacteria bacterium CG06_land_8_20_14_3_00_43_10]|uniref:alanine--tRNA ligase n=1 Tax=Candidatus Berkelbacteria bacterium CG10_big_fil_rev_8_21_14_0_10_43_14 TaxID=1974515 RepID=A0A2M6R7Q0_9BACT|nr:MAG: hypothetical protein AUK41_03630 [Candidatus Berkelbacteria bacterium CG2_30_43_20]PIS06572.1 MAG: alanine--tRNA ligase [Candidatus Berkelbacteria bacterium CG10_big_fil_rev_8_21_14_0_10_43_14]PIU87334.1 MAG: alanine--tRNA ligase [Candidatus Berkelbacteria bacterium CG06_land_8_20_14_3_00_43_10]
MDSTTLRNTFIDFFTKRAHTLIPPAPLVPENDPSVLFTSAGMQQFKRYYSNPDLSSHSRIVTVQPCIRTSDIDEVGDSSHLTYFEMLGNFSFGFPSKAGSYFKEEAITLAWEFLTDVLKIDTTRIYATYFSGEKDIHADMQSLGLLQKIDGLHEIKQQGFDDNFWSLSSEGSPGGPTVEFYVDGLEVWNLVFNEYILENGKYIPSKNKGVDTGMGFERLLATLNGKTDIYETDVFDEYATKIAGLSVDTRQKRIILDHSRAIKNIGDAGVTPSNKDSGYILRRLIRRVMVILKKYDFPITNILGSDVVNQEAQKFNATLQGFDIVSKTKKSHTVSADQLFDFYQTNGIPLEVCLELAHDNDISVADDAVAKFKELFKIHQEKSKSASAGMFKGGLASGGEMETKYHTATHLLLAALRQTLGEEIYQKGSNITDERLRFDFNYPEKLTDDQIIKVEDIVNETIEKDIPVTMVEMPKEEALKTVKVSFDPSKYGDMVKVYSIGDFSSELCGGPHVGSTGVLGKFNITKEESSSAGVRRIKAVLQ